MTKFDKYRRIKPIGYLLVTTKRVGKRGDERGDESEEKTQENKEGRQWERIVPYENNRFMVLIMIVSFVDLLKNGYLMYTPMSLGDRLLYGDIIISLKEDQRLYNFAIIICYGSTLAHYYFLMFGKQKAYFKHLSKFLYVMQPREYSRRLMVTREFAERFSKSLDRGVLANRLVCYIYLGFTASFYAKTLYELISLGGYSFQQILTYTCPSILVGAFGLVNFYLVAVQAYWLFVLYAQMMNGRWSRLTRDLDRLDDRTKHQRKLFKHLANLVSVIKEYKVSREFFQISMLSPMPAVLVTMALFPTNIIVSENLLTNQVILMFSVNLFCVLLPIINSNEKFKRELSLYLNAVHCFMARTRNLEVKLKLMKIQDICQMSSPVTYTLLDGLFDLEKELVPIILAEIFTLTFLIYQFLYYQY